MNRSKKIYTCLCSRISYYLATCGILIFLLSLLGDLYAMTVPFTEIEYNIDDKQENTAI